MAKSKCRAAGLVALAGVAAISVLAGGAEQSSLPFRPGEKLTYSVTWSVFQAGEVNALLEEAGANPTAYQIVTTARSHGIISKLYNLDDKFQSRLDTETLCSSGISKQVLEGRRHKQTDIVFDSARKLAILDERNLAQSSEPPKHNEQSIPPCVEDVVSAFYYLRAQPMHVGDRIEVPVNDGSKTTVVTVEVQAREEIDTPLGRRFAFRVEPAVFGPDSIYKRKGRMLIWFSDDAQRLPLRIKAMISVGTLTGTLASVTGNSTIGPAPAGTPSAAGGQPSPPASASDPTPKSPNLN
jgi:Protein of unknown function (DUF3108)